MEETKNKKNVFKENWLKTDETCASCGQVTKRVRGMTRQNIRRLLIPKFNVNEVIFTLLLVLIIFSAYSYKNETKICNDWIAPMIEDGGRNCLSVCSSKCPTISPSQFIMYPMLNISRNWTDTDNNYTYNYSGAFNYSGP